MAVEELSQVGRPRTNWEGSFGCEV
jgi:hypothetical protein